MTDAETREFITRSIVESGQPAEDYDVEKINDTVRRIMEVRGLTSPEQIPTEVYWETVQVCAL